MSDSLRAAFADPNTNSGRYLCFSIQGMRANDNELLGYCNEWLPVPLIKFDVGGYRPALLCEDDRTAIQLNSGGGSVFIQGRMEAVVILAPVAASFALRIPPNIAKVLPCAVFFWDGLEKCNRLRPTYSCRPPTTVPTGSRSKEKVWEVACQDKSAVTSDQIRNLYSLNETVWLKKVWPDMCESRFQDAKTDLQLRPLSRYLNVSTDEANALISEKVASMIASRSNAWVGVDMQYPARIFVGQFIYYFATVWPDCVLTKCGTRWRPREDGYEKGSVYLTSPEDKVSGCKSLAAIGKVSFLHAWMPVMAACALQIDPLVAIKTRAFRDFFASVNSSPESSRLLSFDRFREGTWVSDCVGNSPLSIPSWASPADIEDWKSSNFQIHHQVCKKQFYVLLHLMTHTNGFWSGGVALPGVSLSRSDFVDWVLMWEPDALVESVGRFRVRPSYLEKGGIGIEQGGAYFSLQTVSEPAVALLIILSSLMAGVPPPIAALCEYAIPFWDFAFAQTNSSKAQITQRRDYLRKLREFNVGSMQQTHTPPMHTLHAPNTHAPPLPTCTPLHAHTPPMHTLHAPHTHAPHTHTPTLPTYTPLLAPHTHTPSPELPTHTSPTPLLESESAIDSELNDVSKLIRLKLCAFNLCKQQSLVLTFGCPVEQTRMRDALHMCTAVESETPFCRITTLKPTRGCYEVQIRNQHNMCLVALRRVAQADQDVDALRRILLAIFMTNRPPQIHNKVQHMINSLLVIEMKP